MLPARPVAAQITKKSVTVKRTRMFWLCLFLCDERLFTGETTASPALYDETSTSREESKAQEETFAPKVPTPISSRTQEEQKVAEKFSVLWPVLVGLFAALLGVGAITLICKRWD